MIEDLFFNTGPALSAIFQLGFKPEPEHFYELTKEQYEHIRSKGENISGKWYMILSEEIKQDSNEVMIVNEGEKDSLLKAAMIIENYCKESKQTFDNYSDKLKYVANLLPPVFSANSRFKSSPLKKPNNFCL
jgi:hypothetical protein